MYLTKDVHKKFIHWYFNQSDIKILSITFVVSDKIYIDKKNYSLWHLAFVNFIPFIREMDVDIEFNQSDT